MKISIIKLLVLSSKFKKFGFDINSILENIISINALSKILQWLAYCQMLILIWSNSRLVTCKRKKKIKSIWKHTYKCKIAEIIVSEIDYSMKCGFIKEEFRMHSKYPAYYCLKMLAGISKVTRVVCQFFLQSHKAFINGQHELDLPVGNLNSSMDFY